MRPGAQIVDACIHHSWPADAELLEYLDPSWRGYVGTPGSLPRNAGMRNWIPRSRYPNPFGDHLADAAPGPGAPACSPAALVRERLEPAGVARALVVFDRAMFVPANPNPYLAVALTRAINDWNIDRWLRADERIFGVALVAVQTPDAAAEEIARVADEERIAGVLLATPALGKSLGHPVYEPIYRAASEHSLPVVLHGGGDALLDVPTGPAGGSPMTFAEYHALAPLALVNQLLSLITNGVLDKYPDLRLYVIGAGASWIPAFLMRFEMIARALRREVPWARRSGEEYLGSQVRICTYGLETAGPFVSRMLERNPSYASWLVYGSGYPSWDTLESSALDEAVPAEALPGVLSETASTWLRWPALAVHNT